MFCKKCGSQLRDDAVYCPDCGMQFSGKDPASESSAQKDTLFADWKTEARSQETAAPEPVVPEVRKSPAVSPQRSAVVRKPVPVPPPVHPVTTEIPSPPAEKRSHTKALWIVVVIGLTLVFLAASVLLLYVLKDKLKPTEESAPSESLSPEELYTSYVRGVLDCTYHNEPMEYVNLTGTSRGNAEALHKEAAEKLASNICELYQVNTEYLSKDTIEAFEVLAGSILEKTEYTVEDAVTTDDTSYIIVEIKPIDLWEIADEGINNYVDNEFLPKYAEDYKSTSEEEKEAIEEEYASHILDILEEYVPEIGYQEDVEKLAEISVDEDGMFGLSEQDWTEIRELLLNLS